MQIHSYCFKQFTSTDNLTYRLTVVRKTSKNLLCGLRAPNGQDINESVHGAHVNIDTFQMDSKCILKYKPDPARIRNTLQLYYTSIS